MRYNIPFLILFAFLPIIGCANVGGVLGTNYSKFFITMEDQRDLKLNMTQEDVTKLLGYPMEITATKDQSQTNIVQMWTYILRYPVLYPGGNAPGNSQVVLGRLKLTEQLLSVKRVGMYAEEKECILVFVNGKLTAFGKLTQIKELYPDISKLK